MHKTTLSALAAALSLAAGCAGATTFTGEFWDTNQPIGNLATVETLMGGSATATFASTGIDYPAGTTGSITDATTLTDFLGVDAASLSGSGSANLTSSIFRFTGSIWLDSGSQTFSVGSDDGFALRIDGAQIAAYNGNRAFGYTTTTTALAEGFHDFELIYWENSGNTGVAALLNGAVITAAENAAAPAVPLPASLPLLVAGLGGLGLVRRRKA